jgi:hypothetical protein
VQALEAGAERAEPEASFRVFHQSANVVARALAHVEPTRLAATQAQQARASRCDPEIAVAIAQDGTDCSAAILRAGIGRELTVTAAEQSAVFRADPECAVVVFEDRAHGIASGAVGDMNLLEAVRRAAIQTADIRSCPYRAVVADLQCSDRGVRKSLLAAVRAHRPAGDLEQRCVGADPDVTVIAGDDGADVSVPQARVVVGFELPVSESQYADARADPQTSLRIGVQFGDDPRAQLRRVAAIENREAHAVEAHEPFVRRQPQIAIRRAGETFDRVLRQTLLDLPVVEDVLADSQVGIECVRRLHCREQ